MLQPSTLTFLSHLSKNNNRPWFEQHRDEYEAAKNDFDVLTGELIDILAQQEPAFKELKPKDCVMRIYRDVRFSKDKTPYKSNFAAGFSRGGKKFQGAGYYVHVEADKAFAGGGVWNPEPALLKAVRQEIDYNFEDFKKIINEKHFKKLFGEINGEKLVKVPQGYAADNPASEYLKLKSFTVSHKLADKDLAGKSLLLKCADIFTTMKPLVDFLNRSLD